MCFTSNFWAYKESSQYCKKKEEVESEPTTHKKEVGSTISIHSGLWRTFKGFLMLFNAEKRGHYVDSLADHHRKMFHCTKRPLAVSPFYYFIMTSSDNNKFKASTLPAIRGYLKKYIKTIFTFSKENVCRLSVQSFLFNKLACCYSVDALPKD